MPQPLEQPHRPAFPVDVDVHEGRSFAEARHPLHLTAQRDNELGARTRHERAHRQDETGGPVVASAAVRPEQSGPAFATHIVDVEVDPETGKVQILRYTAVQDAGQAIYPNYVESQMQGGVAQGVGWALNEEYLYDEQGRLTNASLLDYRMPVTLDLPMIEAIIVEVPNPGHPYGVRGVGEVPIVPPPAALANAIYHAVGVRMNTLPATPARIVAALHRQKG